MKTLNVQAAPGLKLPKEGDPRAYITDAAPVQVLESHYYRKAIADGDLVEVPEVATQDEPAAASETTGAAAESTDSSADAPASRRRATA